MMMSSEMQEQLETHIHYHFKNAQLLYMAMLHPSFSNENEETIDNQRLEFLGDAVIGLVVTDMLYKKYPSKKEGELAKLKSVLVSRNVLSHVAHELQLHYFLLLGTGESNDGGHVRSSNLEDAFEALLGAIYLDGGFYAARCVLEDVFTTVIDHNMSLFDKHANFKSMLQELSQKKFKKCPQYTILEEKGPEHRKTFTVTVTVINDYKGVGTGQNKKSAEQAAAKDLINQLNKLHK